MLSILTALRAQFTLQRHGRNVLALAAGLIFAASAQAQERFSLFVPTEQDDVAKLWRLMRQVAEHPDGNRS